MPKTFTSTYSSTQTLNNPITQNPATVAATGTIDSGSGVGIYGGGGFAWTLVNYGTVESANESGISFDQGGYIVNETGALIQGNGAGAARVRDGIDIQNGTGIVINHGTVSGVSTPATGIALWDGGTVTNTNLIVGNDHGVYIEGVGDVINSGTIKAATKYGVVLDNDGGAVTNSTNGYISGRAAGVDFFSGSAAATLLNNAGAVVIGYSNGVAIGSNDSGYNTIVNVGTIVGRTGDGIAAVGGIYGLVDNIGAVTGSAEGVYLKGVGTVVNSGVIVGGAPDVGVELEGGGTVVDAGTITGYLAAVSLDGDGNNGLALDPGYVLTFTQLGGVDAAGSQALGAINVLELASAASTGTVSGIGTNFVNFGTLAIDTQANWLLAGSNTLGAGSTLVDSGTLTLIGSNAKLSGQYASVSGALVVANGASAALAGSLTVTGTGSLDIDAIGGTTQRGSTLTIGNNLVNGGTVNIADNGGGQGGSTVTVTGMVTNTGTLDVFDDYAAATVMTVAALSDTGTINVHGDAFGDGTGPAELIVAGDAAPATLTTVITVEGPSLLEYQGGSINTIASTGTLVVAGAAFITDPTAPNQNAALTGLTDVAGLFSVANGATVALAGGLTVTGAGTLDIDAIGGTTQRGAMLTVGGNLVNSGTVNIADNGGGQGGSTITVTGTVVNTGTLDVFDDSATATVMTVAALSDTGALTVHGDWGGDGTGPAELIVTGVAAPTVVTTAITVFGPSSLLEYGAGGEIATIAGTGTLTAGGGSFIADGGAATSNSALAGLTDIAGVFSEADADVVSITGNLTVSGTLDIDAIGGTTQRGSTLTVGGNLVNSGTINIADNGGGQGGSTITVTGTVVNTGALDVFDDEATATVMTVAALSATGTLDVHGDAFGDGTGPAELIVTGGAAPTVVTTAITVFGPSSLLEYGAGGEIATIAGTGTLTAGGGSFIADSGAATSNSALTGLTDIAGVFSEADADVVSVTGNLTVSGTLDIDAIGGTTQRGSTLTVGGNLVNSGTINIADNGGGQGGSTITVTGTVVNTGTLDVFDDSPTATVMTVAALADTGALTVHGDWGGDGAGPAELTVTGAATDTGTVTVDNDAVLGAGSLVIGPGGRETVANGGATTAPTILGGLLDLQAGAVANGAITFAAISSTLEIDGASMPGNAIANIADTDTIDLTGLTWNAANAASFNSATGVLSVAGVGVTDTLTLTGVLTGTQFVATSDAGTGTLVTAQQAGGGIVYRGTITTGIVLSNVATQQPATLAAGGYVTNNDTASYGGDAVYGKPVTAWDFTNFGTVKGSGGNADGVELTAGGYVDNAGGAQIDGAVGGVYIFGGSGTVVNSAAITAGTLDAGIYLAVGGVVTNGGTIAGGRGIDVRSAPGIVSNSGAVLANYIGAFLQSGGTLVNSTTGTISGTTGVNAPVAQILVANFGTIQGLGAAPGGFGIANGGGTVVNGANAIIAGNQIAIWLDAFGGTVTNSGGIVATGVGVEIEEGGLVANDAAGATIDASNDAVLITLAAGTVVNVGTLAATGGDGVALRAGGAVDNETGAVIAGTQYAVYIAGAGNVTNDGTLVAGAGADGLLLKAGGTVNNTGTIAGANIGVSLDAGATLVNSGAIVGNTGVDAAAASPLLNAGRIIGTGASGVYMGNGGTVTNTGTITGAPSGGIGIAMHNGGTVDNAAGIVSGGAAGAYLGGGSAVVTNDGTMLGGNQGVNLKATSNLLVNSGLISGTNATAVAKGAYLAGGSATNTATGVIEGYGAGLDVGVAAGTVVNSGFIDGTGASGIGAVLYAGSTLTNAGTIVGAGGVAVSFGGSNNRLVVDPGGVFGGSLDGDAGGGSNDVLELAIGAVAGAIGGIGTAITGFGTVTVDLAAGWLLTGANTLAAGYLLADSGGLSLTGNLVNAGTVAIAAGATVVAEGSITGAGTIAFAGAGASLAIAGTTMPTNVLSGLAPGDRIDLLNLPFSAGVDASYNPAAHALVAGGGTNFDTLTVSGVVAGTRFVATGDGQGGTTIEAVGMYNVYGPHSSGIVLTTPGAPSYQNPTKIEPGATVTNTTGNTFGFDAIYGESNYAWTVSNYGLVNATQAGARGIRLEDGGLVINEATGTISSIDRTVAMYNARGEIENLGTITVAYPSPSTGSMATLMRRGGLVVNGSSNDKTALISGGNNSQGVYFGNFRQNYGSAAAGTVVNFGTISNHIYDDIIMSQGGLVDNLGAILSSDGAGLDMRYGTVINTGLILTVFDGVGSTFAPPQGGPVTVTNLGTIDATGASGAGVRLQSGGLVTNGANSLISGAQDGVASANVAATVNNLGTITSPSGSGVFLGVGGIVANDGLILSTGTGAAVGTPGLLTVVNTGMLGSTGTGFAVVFGQQDAVLLNSATGTITAVSTAINFFPTAVATAYITNDGLIQSTTGADAIAWGGDATGTISNIGTISGGGTNGSAIAVSPEGELVVNGTAGSNAALITAYHIGIGFFPPSTVTNPGILTVVNFGRILSTELSTAAGTGFSGFAIQTGTSAASIIDNFGTIAAVQTNNGGGLLLDGGGDVTNYAGGLIAGVSGVEFFDALGVLTNSGTIASTVVVGQTTGQAVFLGAGGTVTNDGLIFGARGQSTFGTLTGHTGVISTETVAAAIFNSGTIAGNPANNNQGINLLHGGVIDNSTATALITGSGSGSGIYAGGHILSATNARYYYPGATTTVTNYGTIAGPGSGTAIVIVSGGSVVNHGLITSVYGNGISTRGTVAATVENFGTIKVTTTTASGGEAIYLGAGGLVENSGLLDGTKQGSAGSYPGVVQANNQPATVVNLGTIVTPNNSDGVNLLHGGLLINGTIGQTTALLESPHTAIYMGGRNGTAYVGAVGTVVNYGTIENTSLLASTISLAAGGTAINHGLLLGARTTVVFDNVAGTIENYGTIVSTAPTTYSHGAGAYLQQGGLISDKAGGTITALRSAIVLGVATGNRVKGSTTASATVVNLGLVAGTTGVTVGVYSNASNTILNAGTIVANGTITGDGVNLRDGGVVGNSGLISSVFDGVNMGTPSQIPVFSTGDGSEVDGFVDPHWTFTNSATVSGGALVASNPGVDFFNGSPPYAPNSSASAWVDDSTTGDSGGLPYSFATTFSLSGLNVATASLSGLWGVADGGDLELNGNIIATLPNNTGSDWSTLHPFSVDASSGDFVAGVNTLSVVVTAADGTFDGANVEVTGAAMPVNGNTVANSGTIVGSGTSGIGVNLQTGGTFVNSGLVAGYAIGVSVGTQAINIFSTGNGSTTDGVADPHWSFTNSSGVTDSALVANNPGVDFFNASPPWAADTASSAWIVDNTAGPQSGGDPLSFSTTFDLNGLNPATATLSGMWGVDDEGELELNGHVISSINAQDDWQTLEAFSVNGQSGYFLPGVNTLSVVLTDNDNNFEGANVEVSGTAVPILPAVGTVNNSGTIVGTGDNGIGVMLPGDETLINSGTIIGDSDTAISLGSVDTLVIEQGSVLDGSIAGALPSDSFDLPFMPFESGATATLGANNNVLYVVSGESSYNIHLDPRQIFTGISFLPVSDANGDTQVNVVTGTIIRGSNPNGIVLSNPTTQNPAIIAQGAYVGIGGTSYNRAVYGESVYAWTVTNYGTVNGAGSDSTGIGLQAGGTVTNGSPGVTTALIAGSGNAVAIEQAPGAVANFGTIVDTSHYIGVGIHIAHGGPVMNGAPGATGALIAAYRTAIYIGGNHGDDHYVGDTGTITNFATIATTGTDFVAIDLAAGGTVTNYNLITGGLDGVLVLTSPGTITNLGTIVGYGPAYPDAGVAMDNGGILTNAVGGIIDGMWDGVHLNGGGTIDNSGIIRSIGAGASGAAVFDGGEVMNQAGGLILGGNGVFIVGSIGTVTNYGTLSGTQFSGAYLRYGGSVVNGTASSSGTMASPPGALISAVGDGVDAPSGAATVVNYSTIVSTYNIGVDLQQGGTVANEAGGLIQGVAGGVYMFSQPGTVANYGTIVATDDDGVYLGGGGLVTNSNLIVGAFDGVDVRNSAVVVNSGTIVGGGYGNVGGIFIAGGGPFAVQNSGVITSTAGGVRMDSTGTVTNASGAFIQGGEVGVLLSEAGMIANLGTILATAGVGVELEGTGSTLVNDGTVGGTSSAVEMLGYNERVVMAPGAVFSGTIAFSGANDTFQIDGTSMPANTIGGFAIGDTIDLAGIGGGSAGSASRGTNNVLTVAENGQNYTLQLDPSQSFAGDAFVVSSDGSGGTDVTLSTAVQAQLFDFVFTYADSSDYYEGVVADNGSFHYAVNQTIPIGTGTYTIFHDDGTTPDASGTVFVTDYSHDGPGPVSGVPIDTAAGEPDGTGGLGSENDALLGTDGLDHPFNDSTPVSFPVTSLYGFEFSYADGGDFYTGTVADNGSFGVTPGTRTVTNGSGQVVGTYTIFADGQTAETAGTVIVDRFFLDGQPFIPTLTSAGVADGQGGLGSESDSITTLTGATASFNDQTAPAVSLSFPTVTVEAAPPATTVFESEVDDMFQSVLDRDPSSSELATYTNELAGGASVASITQALASSPEAQADLNQVYLQIFGQNIDPTDEGNDTNLLANGTSLTTIDAILGQSPQAQADIGQIFENVLGRSADAIGLTAAMQSLSSGGSLAGVQSTLAHSGEAAADLTVLFQNAESSRAPDAAELVGMEDQLSTLGTTQSGVVPEAGFTLVTPNAGAQALTAVSGVPTEFDFSSVSFTNDTISGFDVTQDAIRLSQSLVGSFPAVDSDISNDGGSALISFSSTGQSILLNGVAPSNLTAANFHFVAAT